MLAVVPLKTRRVPKVSVNGVCTGGRNFPCHSVVRDLLRVGVVFYFLFGGDARKCGSSGSANLLGTVNVEVL